MANSDRFDSSMSPAEPVRRVFTIDVPPYNHYAVFRQRRIHKISMRTFGIAMQLRRRSLTHVVAILFSTTVQATTLNEAIETTLITNPQVRFAVHERLARDQALERARGNYLPTIDTVADVGQERTDNLATRARTGDDITLTRREIEFQATQLLFDGHETKYEVERQTARVESAGYSIMDASQRTALRVVDVYFEVLRRQELLRLSQENLNDHLSIRDQIRLRAEAGVGRRSDLDLIDGRVALAKANVLADEFNLRDAETNYLRVVNEMPAGLTRPMAPTQAMPSSMSDAEAIAVANHPVLSIADADVEATVAQQKTAKSAYYPRFDMQWTLGLGKDLDGIEGDDDELSILVRARWNLYRGGRDQARLRETAFFVDQAKDVRDGARREVVESIRLSWVAHEAAMARLAPLKRRVVATVKTRDAYKKQFNIGQRALLDLLDTENEVTGAQREYWNADINGQIAQYRVLTGMGRLLDTLEIAQPPESRVSGTLSAESGRLNPRLHTPAEPEIVLEEHREILDTAPSTTESGAESAALTPASVVPVTTPEGEERPQENGQNVVTDDAPGKSSFASVRKTFHRRYDDKNTELTIDLSFLPSEGAPVAPATTGFIVAMQDPFIDSILPFEENSAALETTLLNLDLRLPTQPPRGTEPHVENLYVNSSHQ